MTLLMKTITLNGESHQTQAATLAELTNELDLAGKRYAVEVDGELAPKSRHADMVLNDDMTIEVVVAVGGG